MRETDDRGTPGAESVPTTLVGHGPSALRDHLANERTFLAWMRTAIAIVALGFVVAKFSLVFRELSGVHVHPGTARLGAFVGVLLVAAGVATAALASLKFLQVKRDIDHDIINFRPQLDIGLGIIITVVSLVLAVYIVLTS